MLSHIISKRINDRHQLSLTAFGAPQKHAQRHALDDGLKIEEWQKAKNFMGEKDMYRYNAEYGFDKNGRQRYSHFNEYHKPQIVAPFQRTKASHAQPNIPHQSRREDP